MRHDFFNRCLVWRIPRELDSVIETIFRVSSRHLSLNHPTVKRLLRASNNLDTSFANYPSLRSIYQKKKKKNSKRIPASWKNSREITSPPSPFHFIGGGEKGGKSTSRFERPYLFATDGIQEARDTSPLMGEKNARMRRWLYFPRLEWFLTLPPPPPPLSTRSGVASIRESRDVEIWKMTYRGRLSRWMRSGW